MTVVDGICYHLRSDGTASVANRHDVTPFAVITWFTTQTPISVSSPASRTRPRDQINDAIDSTRPGTSNGSGNQVRSEPRRPP